MTAYEPADGPPPARELPDARKAQPSGLYDYVLGGKDNYGPDRTLMDEAVRLMPGAPAAVRAQRLFVDRAVRYLVREAGVRQILDIGSGKPQSRLPNVHETAQGIAPDTRVAYVDNNQVAVAHMAALQATNENTIAFTGDFSRPQEILDRLEAWAPFDFGRPVAVLLAGILHFVPDAADPVGSVARLRDATAPGSHLVLNHISSDLDPHVPAIVELFAEAATPMVDRGRAELERFLDGYELVEPGLVPVDTWRPDVPPQGSCDAYAAVARKA